MSFNFTDAWVIQSIYHSEKQSGATLADIIAYADYINHAILTYEELSNSLTKLVCIGLVRQDNTTLMTTEAFKDWWKNMFQGKKRIYVHKELSEIEKYLNETFGETEMVKEIAIQITKDAFNNAVKTYIT